MSVLRRDNHRKDIPVVKGSGKIAVRCPKCRETIGVTEIKGNRPIRCAKCSYPLIRRSDLMLIVAACKKPDNSNQVSTAMRILQQLAEILPEAGTALGEMADTHTLPISDTERWNMLNESYAQGDENARELLNRMCKANPGIYGQRICKGCGATQYFIKGKTENALCSYCQSTD